MIILQMMQKICRDTDKCEICPFYDKEVAGVCLFSYDPCDWDIKRIEKAFDDTHIIDEFYTELTHKLLEVMPSKYIDKDKLAAVYEEDEDDEI